MPEASALEFNLKHASTAGIIFESVTKEYYRFDEHSVQYPELKFHYEFWYEDDTLYASLHTNHRPVSGKADRDINLALKIHSFAQYIIREVKTHFDPHVKWDINIPAAADEENTYCTHILNFVCRPGDPAYNASLMLELIKATRKFKI